MTTLSRRGRGLGPSGNHVTACLTYEYVGIRVVSGVGSAFALTLAVKETEMKWKEDSVKTFVMRAALVTILQLMIVIPLLWVVKSVV